MRTTDIVMNIAGGHIDRMEFLVTGGDGDRGLVRAEDNRYEHGAVGGRVLRDSGLHTLLVKECDEQEK